MARISGVTIPNEKQIHAALTYIYGIGPKTSVEILSDAKVERTVRVKDLTDAEISRIQEVINSELAPAKLLMNPFVKVRPVPERLVVEAFVANKVSTVSCEIVVVARFVIPVTLNEPVMY